MGVLARDSGGGWKEGVGRGFWACEDKSGKDE